MRLVIDTLTLLEERLSIWLTAVRGTIHLFTAYKPILLAKTGFFGLVTDVLLISASAACCGGPPAVIATLLRSGGQPDGPPRWKAALIT